MASEDLTRRQLLGARAAVTLTAVVAVLSLATVLLNVRRFDHRISVSTAQLAATASLAGILDGES
jgi:hypothetical protein